MIFLTFLAAFILSGIAGYYSVIGLALIFPGAFIPVVIMGSALEFSKLVTASWLYRNWKKAPFLLKTYLTFAVIVLMLITSMGIFGFLSKAHIEHSVDTAPLVDKVSVYEEKINTLKGQIDENKRAISQMDAAVNEVLSRSTTERSAVKSVQIRKSQQKERTRLSTENQSWQSEISKLTEEKAPVVAAMRKNEAEFGPIKYVAELVYGSSEGDIIDKSVRLVIMIIMLVFDPLAVLLLISANLSMRKDDENEIHQTTNDTVLPPMEKASKTSKPKKTRPVGNTTIEIAEENITNIGEDVTTTMHLAPGLYAEQKTNR